MSSTELNQARKSLLHSEADLAYCLELFGDHLATKHGYSGLDGFDAIRYYLMQKHHWLPRDLAALSHNDMRLALHAEMKGWTLPQAAR